MITLTARDIQDFRDVQLKEGKANTTANMVVKTLRIPLNVARRQGLILTNPAEAVDMVDPDSAERQVFTPEQIKTLLKKADKEWKGLILLGACAGMRIGDAARTTWANVDFENKVLRFFPQKTARKANCKPLEVVMLPDVESWLLSHPATSRDPNAPLFKTLHKKPVGGKVGLSESFLDLMKEAGVDKTTVVEKKKGSKGRSFNALTFHSLRHTFVSIMANMGVSQEIRMKLAGHTSDVHQRYTHHEIDTLRTALKTFPSFV